jgi:regulatory protein
MTTSEALQKLQRYCAYQERSPFEVERKLQQLGLPRDRHEEVVAQLMTDNFLDEYRFAEAFTRGKLNQKQWAPRRIRMGLQEHRIPRVTVDRILGQIDPSVVEANALYLADRWYASKTKAQLTSALQRRGYDYETINTAYEEVERQRSEAKP